MTRAVLLLLLLAGHREARGFDFFDLFQDRDTLTRVKANGYPCKKHYVTTDDGYTLGLFRVPYGKESTESNATRPAVLVLHGLLCSSDCWVAGNTSRALAYVLADSGYDVWLLNSRGNTYSRNHTSLTVEDDAFWNFSFHEMGYYDIPAVIDYVLEETGLSSVAFIGHSQGTTAFFVMASTRPEYAAKLSIANNLAPVMYINQAKGTVKALGKISKLLEVFLKSSGTNQILQHNFVYTFLVRALCKLPLGKALISNIIFEISGYDWSNLDKDVLCHLGDFCPAGISSKDVFHYGQWTRNGGKFNKFDYGGDNLKYYNTTEAPEYQLTNITCPVALYYSDNDFIDTKPETERIIGNLSSFDNYVEAYEVPFKAFNHVDFMWGVNAKEMVYEEILKNMKKYVST